MTRRRGRDAEVPGRGSGSPRAGLSRRPPPSPASRRRRRSRLALARRADLERLTRLGRRRPRSAPDASPGGRGDEEADTPQLVVTACRTWRRSGSALDFFAELVRSSADLVVRPRLACPPSVRPDACPPWQAQTTARPRQAERRRRACDRQCRGRPARPPLSLRPRQPDAAARRPRRACRSRGAAGQGVGHVDVGLGDDGRRARRPRGVGTSTPASVTIAPAGPWRRTAPISSVIGTRPVPAMVTASPRSSKPPRPVSIRVPAGIAALGDRGDRDRRRQAVGDQRRRPATTARSVFGTSRCTSSAASGARRRGRRGCAPWRRPSSRGRSASSQVASTSTPFGSFG